MEIQLNETEVATLQRMLYNLKKGKISTLKRYGFPYIQDDIKIIDNFLLKLMGDNENLEPIDADIAEKVSIEIKSLNQFSLRDLIKRRRAIQRAIARSQSGQTQPPTQRKLDYWTTELRDVIKTIQQRYIEPPKQASK